MCNHSEMTLQLLIGLAVVAAAAYGVRVARSEWRGAGGADPNAAPEWWPFDLPAWRGLIRTGPVAAVEGLLVGTRSLASFLHAPSALDAVLQGAILLTLALMLLVALYNRPAWAVAPRFRAMPGAVAEWNGLSRFSGSRATVRPMHDHDRGLSHDLPLITRRRALAAVTGGLGLLIAGCGSSDSGGSAKATPAAAGAVPEETAGPFPGDGSNGPNVLSESGVVRRDITKSFGDASGVAEGVPTTLELKLVDVAGGGGAARGRGGLRLALRPGRPLLALRRRHRVGELPARRAGERRRREALVPDDLPGGVLGPLAAHPLRGLRGPRRRDGGELEAPDVADRAPRGRLRPRVRGARLRAERAEPGRHVAGERHGLQRRLRRASSPRRPATPSKASRSRSTSGSSYLPWQVVNACDRCPITDN